LPATDKHDTGMEYLSKERYDEIVAELDNLMNVEYPRIRDDLSEARAQGDLSENAEYRAARRAQGKAISRIRFLQKVLQHSRIIDKSALPKDRISLLSKVEFTHLGTGRKMTYTIVSHHEMDLDHGKLSCNSPIGLALMGRKVGETVEVNAPAGKFQIRIDSVTID
jgi:transcription elongation factor GreA